MDHSTIGIGIVTCNRPIFFDKCYKSFDKHIKGDIDHRVIVINDGSKPIKHPSREGVRVVNHDENWGVCASKNQALEYLLENPKIEHFFLIEDDIIAINSLNPFEEYIKVAQATGLQHLMYGYHGPANKTGSHGIPTPRLVVEYKDNVFVALNQHCVGAFCYYSRTCLDAVGLLDTNFYQAFDHVEHSYRIAMAGMCPGYWWWPDIAKSTSILGEVACSEESSSIRFKDPTEWHNNIQKAAEYFKEKHGYLPAWNGCVPDIGEQAVYTNLKQIYKDYGND